MGDLAMTRADFLKLAAVASGLGASGLRLQAAEPGPVAAIPAASAAARAASSAAAAGEAADCPDSRRFREAVMAGDLVRVRAGLAADPALAWSRDERGRSVLLLACLAGRTEVAALLRERLPELDMVEAVFVGDGERVRALRQKLPALIDELHPLGGSPAHAAALAGRPDMVMALVGADFNSPAVDPPGLTALRLAAQHPDLAAAEEMVDTMVGNGGDPRAPQGDGVSILHAAASAGGIDMIRVLVLDGADVAARDPEGQTPLLRAERRGHPGAAELLRNASRLPRDHRTSRFAWTADGSPFHLPAPALPKPIVNPFVAAAHGDLEQVKTLLALYPNLLHENAAWDELAVEGGAHTGYRDGVAFLLDRGAPMSICTASMMGRPDRVRSLLAEDPLRIWEHGAHNFPPLLYPAFGGGGPGQLECAELLLAAGADVNAHKRGQTALHRAAGGGQSDLVTLLLARGADRTARWKTPTGERTALDVALAAGQQQTADLLRTAA